MTEWENSAQAWIASLGERGDRGRQFVLDPAMKPLLATGNFKRTLDVGCGEGRLCRIMAEMGIETTGLDPTDALIAYARSAHPNGRYVEASAQNMPFTDASFDLVVSCLSLIDIPNYRAAIIEMVRVLEPGGTLMIANQTSFKTAGNGQGLGWQQNLLGHHTHYAIDHYLDDRADRESWKGINVINHHRPLSAYMSALLEQDLVLKHFSEPEPVNAPPEWAARYRRTPWFLVMVWQKP
jgi:SAM-dependent methyltransferase